MKAAVGITSTHIYFIINGMMMFSERHNDTEFLNKPLKYRITNDSVKIFEINVHSLCTEIGQLRAKQNRSRYPATSAVGSVKVPAKA
jgi:hypothetical protein